MSVEKDHVRFEALHSALSYALQKTLSKLTLKTFVSCYPQIDHVSLDYVRKQIVKSWKNRAELEFQKIFIERDLKNKLDELDDIVDQGERQKEIDIKNGGKVSRIDVSKLTSTELSKAFLITSKKEELKTLEEELIELRNSNNKLMEQINSIKKEVNEDLSDFNSFTDDLAVLDELDENKDDELFREIVKWAIDEIVQTT